MNGSYIHLVHLIAFGLVMATLIPSFVLDRKLRAEPDWGKKLQIGGLMRVFGMFAPVNIMLLLLSGIGNIYNRFLGSPDPWYDEHWLLTKLGLFVIIIFNAILVAPRLGMKRAMVIKALAEKKDDGGGNEAYAALNKKITILFAVQSLLLLGILWLSVFGPGKHPGVF